MTQRKPIFVDTVKEITGKDAPAFSFIHRIYEQKRALGFIPYRVLCREQVFQVPVDVCGLDQEAYEARVQAIREEWDETMRRRLSSPLFVAAQALAEETYLAKPSPINVP